MSDIEYHWIMTITWPRTGGLGMNTSYGTTVVGPGESRNDVFQRLFAYACGQSEAPAEPGANVLFFGLEPNRFN